MQAARFFNNLYTPLFIGIVKKLRHFQYSEKEEKVNLVTSFTISDHEIEVSVFPGKRAPPPGGLRF
jgi:hypothetical protein